MKFRAASAMVIPLALMSASASAATPSAQTAFVNKATASAQAVVMKVVKQALKNVTSDSTFQGLLNNAVASNSQSMAATGAQAKFQTLFNKEVAALKAKSSVVAPAAQTTAIASLRSAFAYAVSTNAVTGVTGSNVVDIVNATGSGTHTVSFVLDSATAQSLQSGNAAVSLSDMQKYWKGQLATSSAALKNTYSEFFLKAFASNLAADSLGCKAFSGYYTGSNYTAGSPATLDTPAPAGC